MPRIDLKTGLKLCSACNLEKEAKEFPKHRGKPDGLNYECRVCVSVSQKVTAKKYRETHKDKIREWNRIYIKKKLQDPDFKRRVNEVSKKYYYANKERLNKKRVWYGSNTVTGRAVRRAYLRRRNGILLSFPKIDYQDIVRMYKNTKSCFYCEEPLGITEFQVDHYIPIARGGAHTIENLRISCRRCNAVKNSKDPIYFIQNMLPKIRQGVYHRVT